jgi:hypothetical protein
MLKRFFALVLAFVVAGVCFPSVMLVSAAGFNSQLSPGKIVSSAERGQELNFKVRFTNLLEGGGSQPVRITTQDIVYDDEGRQLKLDVNEVLDTNQSLRSWIDVGEGFDAVSDEPVTVPVKIKVPNNAAFGDHYAAIYFSSGAASQAAIVGVQARLATMITLKILGGDPVLDGKVKELKIETREKARNTATINFVFQNTGSEFFKVATAIDIFDVPKPTEEDVAIKTITREDSVFPNVRKKVSIKVGDLGEDYGETEYYARIQIVQKTNDANGKVFLNSVKPFDYFLPVLSAAPEAAVPPPPLIEKPVYVQSPMLEIVRELGLYIGGFIILVIVLIRVLFFSGGVSRKKSSRRKK